MLSSCSSVDLSVVSLTWNSARFVQPFLGSLMANIESSKLRCEVIVVDNGSSDTTLRQLRGLQQDTPDLTVVPLGSNTGTTFSRNVGIRMSRGRFILIIDSDTIVPEGFIEGLVGATQNLVDAGEPVGLAHPKLTYPDGEFQESARKVPTLPTKVYRLLGYDRLRQKNETIPEVMNNVRTPVDYAISAAWLVPRSTFEQIGLLDESIFYAPEDLEFCVRCWNAGLSVWYVPEVTLLHDCQRITSKKPFSMLGLSHIKGLLKFWARYGGFFRRPKCVPSGGGNVRAAQEN